MQIQAYNTLSSGTNSCDDDFPDSFNTNGGENHGQIRNGQNGEDLNLDGPNVEGMKQSTTIMARIYEKIKD